MAWKTKATLQEINISHLGKRKIIFKMDFSGDVLVPRRVVPHSFPRLVSPCHLHGSKLLMHPCFFNQGFFHDRLAPGRSRRFPPCFGGNFHVSFFGGGNQQKHPNHWEKYKDWKQPKDLWFCRWFAAFSSGWTPDLWERDKWLVTTGMSCWYLVNGWFHPYI